VATFVDTTVQQIEARLSELTEEASRLQAARAALAGNGASPAPRRRRPGRPRKTAANAPAGAAMSEAPEPVAPRRGPGRPRKSTTAARSTGVTPSPTRTRRRRTRKATVPAASATAAESTSPATPARKPGRQRGRRAGGGRATEALALVKKQPGVTIPQLAAAMKIQPNYLYRVLPKLAADGEIKRDGKGWHPAS
jgi:hypothetical protein